MRTRWFCKKVIDYSTPSLHGYHLLLLYTPATHHKSLHDTSNRQSYCQVNQLPTKFVPSLCQYRQSLTGAVAQLEHTVLLLVWVLKQAADETSCFLLLNLKLIPQQLVNSSNNALLR